MKPRTATLLASGILLAGLGAYRFALPLVYRTDPFGLDGTVYLRLVERAKGELSLEFYPRYVDEGGDEQSVDRCRVPLVRVFHDGQTTSVHLDGLRTYMFCEAYPTKDESPAGAIDLSASGTRTVKFVRGDAADSYTFDVRDDRVGFSGEPSTFTRWRYDFPKETTYRVPKDTIWVTLGYPSERERVRLQAEEARFFKELEVLGAKRAPEPPAGDYHWESSPSTHYWFNKRGTTGNEPKVGSERLFEYKGDLDTLRQLVRSFKQYYSAQPHAWNLSLEVGTWQGPNYHN